MRLIKSLSTWLLCIVVAFSVFGCLPSELRKQAKGLATKLDNAKKVVGNNLKIYDSIADGRDFDKFKTYAERENWREEILGAQNDLADVERILDTEVKGILERNEKSGAPKLTLQIRRIRMRIGVSQRRSREPFTRIDELKRVMKDAPGIAKTAEREMVEISKIYSSLVDSFIPTISKDPRAQDRAADIDKKFAPLKKLHDDAVTALALVQLNLRSHNDGETADYAYLGDSAKRITGNLTRLKVDDGKFRKKINELINSYTKILKDMRRDYFVQIKREAWADGSDWYSPHFYTYIRQVSMQDYNHLSKLPAEFELASYGSWRGFKSKVDSAVMSRLNINPKENLSGWDDAAVYWIEDVYTKDYHKYTFVRNGVETASKNWEVVDEEDFDDYADSLGMEIMSKPYGKFEEEANDVQAPPGMNYVGNEHYGRWQKDPQSGDNFWEFYGKYAFFSNMMGGNRYYYNDWDNWNRNYRRKGPYYGGSGSGTAVYGTYGSHVRSSTRYANSSFAKSGGLKTAPASVRGAGRSSRGRGGRGGK